MVKILLLPLNVLFLFGISSFLTGDLSIDQKAPARIPVQGTCEVELVVNKGDVTGFAKLQHAFPTGVKVEAIETQGATFTFAEQKMKWIWMALPKEESFTIKYKLTVEDEYITEVELGGTFSYLEKNERRSFYIPASLLAVGEEKVEEEVKEPVVATNRVITDEGSGNYRVDVTIKRENVTGFAKIQEYIPAGVSASSIAEESAVFSVVNDKVKFVWMNLPDANEFTVSYRINTGGSALSPNSISGEFAYIHDGQTLKATILGEESSPAANEFAQNDPDTADNDELVEVQNDAEEIALPKEESATLEAEAVVAIATGKENATEPLEAKQESTENEDEAEIAEEPVTAATNEDLVETDVSKKSITTVPEPNTGINYRVQILAGHNNVKQPYFESLYKYTGNFIVENHEGWVKYTTGDYPIYKNARDGREVIRSNYNFPGPFVVAYNNGERITVQEALMITNQNWVK